MKFDDKLDILQLQHQADIDILMCKIGVLKGLESEVEDLKNENKKLRESNCNQGERINELNVSFHICTSF
mgnify:CR=1 FL=1